MNKVIALLLCALMVPSVAAQRRFDVEIIIFKRSVSPEQTNESWPDVMDPLDFSRAGSLYSDGYLKSKGVTRLPKSSYHLNGHVNQLNKHAGYQVMLHTAWRQGDRGQGSSPIFHIRTGRDYSNDYNLDGSKKYSFTESLNSEIAGQPAAESAPTGPVYELDGTIQVYVQHYLFLNSKLDLKSPSVREVVVKPPLVSPSSFEQQTDLDRIDTGSQLSDTGFNSDSMSTNNQLSGFEQAEPTVQFDNLKPVEETVEVEQFLKSYRMDQKRRMRSGEIHYLDHPLMGVIIQVRKAPA